MPNPIAKTFADVLRKLRTSLLIAGAAFAAVMGLVVVALLTRIGEGFAIFG
ncbi:hypothetical protein [Novosphingobium sp.]|uniref:hypothetical protein n=1 Tax=Novosphingobium sp. TaxID=1874826 RepID=UPI0025F37A17|nr:hypothetical protein [Novosphingobium sp.]